MKDANRLVMLNQMAGPLFRELAEEVSPHFGDGVLLYTGHPDTLSRVYVQEEKLKVLAAPTYDRRSLLRRLASWGYYLLAVSRLIIGGNARDRFLIVSNPPLLGGWFWLLTRFSKRPYIVLVYDIHPDVLVTMGVISSKNPIVGLWHKMNKMVYRDADAVVTLGNHMALRIQNNQSDTSLSVDVVPPWADVHYVKPCDYHDNPLAAEFNPEGKHIVLYSGNMGISHDINSMLGAVKLLTHRQDILFLFIGAGAYWQVARDYRDEHSLDNIQVYPLQPEDNLPYTMALASISLVALGEGAEELMVPSKIFYYLAAGSAVVGVCKGQNELKDVIDQANCGVCVPPGNPNQLASAIEGLIDDQAQLTQFQKNSRTAAVNYYSKEAGVHQFLSLFKKKGWIQWDRTLETVQ